MKLIRGDKLPAAARREVLAAFGYRWTSDNDKRLTWYKPCPSCDIRTPYVNTESAEGHNHPTIPLVTDAQWLAEHAFYVTKDGRLAANRTHAEPAFLADDE